MLEFVGQVPLVDWLEGFLPSLISDQKDFRASGPRTDQNGLYYLIPTCGDTDSIGFARSRRDLIQDGELKEVRHDQWSCGPASR